MLALALKVQKRYKATKREKRRRGRRRIYIRTSSGLEQERERLCAMRDTTTRCTERDGPN